MEQYYTLQEVMARLNISRDTIMGLIRKGKIPGTIKLSNVFRIPESGIQRFLEVQTVQPRKPFYVPRQRKQTNSKTPGTANAGWAPLTMDVFKKG